GSAVLAVILIGLATSSFLAFQLSQKNNVISQKNEELEEKQTELKTKNDEVEGQREELKKKNEDLAAAKDRLVGYFQRAIFKPLTLSNRFSETELIQNFFEKEIFSPSRTFGDQSTSDLFESLSGPLLIPKKTSSRRLWQSQVTKQAIAPHRIASGDFVTGNIRIWDSASKDLLHSFQVHYEPEDRVGFWPTITWIYFHPINPNLIYTAGLDGKIALWDYKSQSTVSSYQVPKQPQITAVAVDQSGDSPSFVLSTEQGDLIRIHSETLVELQVDSLVDSRINSVAVNPKGDIAIAANDNSLVVCDADFKEKHNSTAKLPNLLCVAYSPSGQQFVAGGDDGMMYLFDAKTHNLVKEIEAHQPGEHATDQSRKVRSIQWLQDGRVVSGGSDGAVKIWNSNFDSIQTLKGHGPNAFGRDDILSAIVDGEECISIGRDHTMRIWDLKTGSCTYKLEGALFPHQNFHSSDYARFSYCSKTNRLLVANDSMDAYARIWDLSRFSEVSKYANFPFWEDNEAPITQDVAINSDGSRFVVAEPNGNLTFWDSDAKKPTRSITAHSVSLYTINPRLPLVKVIWPSDDNRIYSIGQDYKLLVIDAKAMKIIDTIDLADDENSVLPADTSNLSPTEQEETIRTIRNAQFDNQLYQLENELITIGRDNIIRGWDLENKQIAWRIGVAEKITASAISDNQKFLIVGTDAGSLFRVDLSTKNVASINTSFLELDRLVDDSRSVFKVDQRQGQQINEQWKRSVRSIAISNNNQLFAMSTGTGIISLFESETGIYSRSIAYDPFQQSMRQVHLLFSKDDRLFSIGADRCIREWDIYNSRQTSHGATKTRTSRLIHDQSADRQIQIGQRDVADDSLWLQSDGQWYGSRPFKNIQDMTDAAFVPGTNEVILSTLYGRVIRFDLANSKIISEFDQPDQDRKFETPIGPFKEGSLVAVSYDGRLVASTWSNGDQHSIDIWRRKTGQWLASIKMPRGVESLVFHPSDNQLATADQVGNCRVFELLAPEQPEEKFKSKGPQFATGLAYSTDGKILFQSGQYYNNRILSVWNSQTGAEINPSTGEPYSLNEIERNSQQDLFEADYIEDQFGNQVASYLDVATSPNGKWLATAGLDGFLVLWSIEDSKIRYRTKILTTGISDLDLDVPDDPVRTIHTGQITNVHFSNDSKKIFYTTIQGPICVAKIDDMLRLADLNADETYEEISKITSLRINEENNPETIEQNQLVPNIAK
ncbi:MAG: hypothetical protein AAF939_05325, partial [Planctomycetota bacterium]